MTSVSRICSEYLEICERRKSLAKYTLKAYKIDLAQFADYIGRNLAISAVSKAEIELFYRRLTELELAPTSIKRKLACVKAMFRWLELEEVVDSNPFHKVRTEIRLPKRLPKNVPANDLLKMIQSARSELRIQSQDDYKNQSFATWIGSKKQLNKLTTLVALELMLCTGIRVGELSNVSFSDLEIDERKIKIFGKGSRERYVYLPDEELCELLKDYIQARGITEPENNALLVNSRGKPASTQFLRKLIKNVSLRANTKQKVTPHMLRHSAACELLESGLDIRFVQRLLGHSSISTTEIYTHVSDQLLKAKVTQANVRGRIMKK